MRKVVSSSLCGNRQKLHLRGSCAGGALCTAGGRRCRSCHRAAARRPPRPHRTRSTCMATRSMSVTFAGAPVHQALRHNCSAGDLPLGSIAGTSLPLARKHWQPGDDALAGLTQQQHHATCSGHCRGGPEKVGNLWTLACARNTPGTSCSRQQQTGRGSPVCNHLSSSSSSSSAACLREVQRLLPDPRRSLWRQLQARPLSTAAASSASSTGSWDASRTRLRGSRETRCPEG